MKILNFCFPQKNHFKIFFKRLMYTHTYIDTHACTHMSTAVRGQLRSWVVRVKGKGLLSTVVILRFYVFVYMPSGMSANHAYSVPVEAQKGIRRSSSSIKKSIQQLPWSLLNPNHMYHRLFLIQTFQIKQSTACFLYLV